ncbi:hypothetical protein [Segetibacter koreensis]|uniref:hypothetical protein n=1 Tax=Segetibacter koreensis TaxID=398037 RepID=UPI0012FAFD30|nr:hypothetical protein [Segetibacter koreensis]
MCKQVTNPADTSFEISFTFPPDGIKTGSFTTDDGNAVSYSHNGICVNCAWKVAYNLNGAITNIIVTDYDVTTKTIKGTFSGTTINGQNALVPIKNGRFKAVIE